MGFLSKIFKSVTSFLSPVLDILGGVLGGGLFGSQQNIPPPPAPPKPIGVPQNIVGDRTRQRRRLSGGPGQNRTILGGVLSASDDSGNSLLG